MKGINLAGKLATFSEHYRPKTVGQFNGSNNPVLSVVI